MAMTIHQRESDGIVILDLQGRLVMGSEVGDVRRRFELLAAPGETRVILNLAKVDFIDSTGLGTLVVGHSLMRDAGGAMKLLSVSKRTMELLVLSKLTTIFELFDDEQAAIDSFFPDREVTRFDILEFVKSQEGEEQHLGSEPAKNTE
jgi:anti-sigma B factor antagonist